MSDPRLGGRHLNVARRDQYDATIDEILDDRGPLTSEADPLVRRPSAPRAPVPRVSPPPGGTYMLMNLADGSRHPLRVGINTVGRFPENDLVLVPLCVSRRHCVVLVHAAGGCEVYDTASRHGTWVNRGRVGRVELFPGDILMVTNQKFLVTWVAPGGELLPSAQSDDTACLDAISPTA